MTSLRNRIAGFMILAIVVVIALATLVAMQMMQRPLPETATIPVARQIAWNVRFAEADPQAAAGAGIVFADAPAPGLPEERSTGRWTRVLGRQGMQHPLVVTADPQGTTMRISVDLGDRWLVLPLPDLRPPRGGWRIFGAWMALIVTGATAVSLIAATRITGPLRILENAVDRIGRDGVLVPIPETGLPETQATARALNHLSARLKSAMESRMRLVAAAGHDLRTPMTRMRLRAEFVEDDDEREKWLADLAELDAIADSAIRLVRDEVTQAAAQDLRLDRLVGDVAQELGALGYRVTVASLAPVTVTADPLLLKRAVRNLVINAATHGKAARVSLSRQVDRAELVIEDDGPGIPEPLMERAFEPFFRVDEGRRKALPGAGLGMAIARQIIDQLGGAVTLANMQAGGLRQRVVLPARAWPVSDRNGSCKRG
ncbi:ATP-binding protein [Paracoccus fontiphilus]|uniref:histidine kinase n=1 Tax=Paracoccus fontiphilus TaxID=1815556 RepID=A0ABV7IDD0_9RHOB